MSFDFVLQSLILDYNQHHNLLYLTVRMYNRIKIIILYQYMFLVCCYYLVMLLNMEKHLCFTTLIMNSLSRERERESGVLRETRARATGACPAFFYVPTTISTAPRLCLSRSLLELEYPLRRRRFSFSRPPPLRERYTK